MIVSQIVAMAKNRVIGRDGKLPWHIPEDLEFFKNKTSGRIVIMGRKTWESLPRKPLPKRLNVLITRELAYQAPGATVVHSIPEALEFAQTEIGSWGDEIFILGGEEIFKNSLPFTNRIYLTEISKDFEGDVYFPEFDKTQFKLTEKSDRQKPYPFSFCTYDRID